MTPDEPIIRQTDPQEVLDKYAACEDSAAVVEAQEAFLRDCFDEMQLRKAEEDDLPSMGSYSSGSECESDEGEGSEEGAEEEADSEAEEEEGEGEDAAANLRCK